MVLGGRAPGAADVEQLSYLRMVIAESMRLYPPAWILGRRAIADCTIGGQQVAARGIVFMSQYVTQRDPRWYPEPGALRPAALDARGDGATTEVRLLPVRRRVPGLHR